MSDSNVDDPTEVIITIKLQGKPQRVWQVKKSLLVKHSGFFRAMFRHEFRETMTNTVTLHDDDVYNLDEVISFMSEGQWYRWYVYQGWWKDWQDDYNNQPIENIGYGGWMSVDTNIDDILGRLRLAAKYDVPKLRDQTWKAFEFYWNQASKARLNRDGHIAHETLEPDRFLETPQAIVELNGGFPSELYHGFALAYHAFKFDDCDVASMTEFMETDAKLASFTASYLLKKLVGIQQTVDQSTKAIKNAMSE